MNYLPLTVRMLWKIQEARFRKSLFKLNLAVTRKCNSRCKTCKIWEAQDSADELSLEEIRSLAGALPKSVYWVAMTGGEPFLRPDFEDLVSVVLEAAPQISIVSIPTNGTLVEKTTTVVRELASKNPVVHFFIQISVDGCEDTHEFIRGTPYRLTRKTIDQLSLLERELPNISIKVEFNASKHNFEELNTVAEDFRKQNVSLICTVAHNSSFYCNEEEEGDLLPLPVRKSLIEQFSRFEKGFSFFRPDHIFFKLYIKGVKLFLKNQKFPLSKCYAGLYSIYLSSEGFISPCISMELTSMNIRDYHYSVTEVFESPAYQKALEKVQDLTCPHCWTPCEAFNSLMFTPITGLSKLFRPRKEKDD